MRQMGHPRDYIFSYIIQPGRTLTPACIAEVEQGKIGPEIGPASLEEVERFLSFRLTSVRPSGSEEPDAPLSSYKVRQVLKWFAPGQAELFPYESEIAEFKLILLGEKRQLAKYAKTIAALANNKGGYLFFGVGDNGGPASFDAKAFRQFNWDSLAAIVNSYFQPAVLWEQGVVEIDGRNVGAIHVYQSDRKPIMAVRDFDPEIREGRVYYRYRGITTEIKYGDLMHLLQDRDDLTRKRLLQGLEIKAASPAASPPRRKPSMNVENMDLFEPRR